MLTQLLILLMLANATHAALLECEQATGPPIIHTNEKAADFVHVLRGFCVVHEATDVVAAIDLFKADCDDGYYILLAAIETYMIELTNKTKEAKIK